MIFIWTYNYLQLLQSNEIINYKYIIKEYKYKIYSYWKIDITIDIIIDVTIAIHKFII